MSQGNIDNIQNALIALQARVETVEANEHRFSHQLMALRSDLEKLTRIMETNKDMSQQAWNEISASIKDTIGAIRSEFSMNIRSAVTHAVT